jgi:hypothetical protein
MFLPFYLYYETLLTRRARLLIEPEYLPKLSFDILGACEGLRTSLRGWIGQQTSPFTANQY